MVLGDPASKDTARKIRHWQPGPMSAPNHLNARDPPIIVKAPTGRGKCQTSQEPIAQGELKVGMVGRSSGVSVVKWMKPQCFCANMRVEYAPTGRAKCTTQHDESAPFIGKGEPRLLFRMMKTSCEGTEVSKCQQIYNPANPAVGELVRKYLDLEGVTTTVQTIGGLDELDSHEHRRWVIDSLEGRDMSSRSVPVRAAVAAKPKARPPKKKREDAESDEAASEGGSAAKRAKKAAPKRKPLKGQKPADEAESEEGEEAELAD